MFRPTTEPIATISPLFFAIMYRPRLTHQIGSANNIGLVEFLPIENYRLKGCCLPIHVPALTTTMSYLRPPSSQLSVRSNNVSISETIPASPVTAQTLPPCAEYQLLL